MTTTTLRIEQLELDGGTQTRAEITKSAVEDYAEAMSGGAELPPITVFYDGKRYWLADGFHRVHAALYLGQSEIAADVRQGTHAEAQWHSLSANQTHGLRRTRADVERAIKFALKHPEIVPNGENSNRGIATHIGCSHHTVQKYREELEASGQIAQIKERQVERNGTVYLQNTSNIGKRPTAPPANLTLPEPDEVPPFDPETGEIVEPEPERAMPAHLLQAAAREMAPQPYSPPTQEQADAADHRERLRRVLSELVKLETLVTPEDVRGRQAQVAGVTQLADAAQRLLSEWLEEPKPERDMSKVISVN